VELGGITDRSLIPKLVEEFNKVVEDSMQNLQENQDRKSMENPTTNNTKSSEDSPKTSPISIDSFQLLFAP
jgi:hypothetical protein